MALNFNAFHREIIFYFQDHTYITAALAGVLLLLMFKKPKLFFIVVLIVAINLSSLYVISNISSLGKAKKQNLIRKSTVHAQTYSP
jgi:hypothetical protein